MALTGSLKDLGVAELIRIPSAGRKTGELIIASPENDARLYFVEGSLVHVEMDGETGQPVLDKVAGWTEGEFEFRPNVLTDTTCAPADVEAALGKSGIAAGEPRRFDPDKLDLRMQSMLAEHLHGHEFLVHLCVLGEVGQVLAAVNAGSTDPEGAPPLCRALIQLARGYPRKQLQRLIIEDDLGTVAYCSYDNGRALFAVADRSTRVGAVSVSLDRLIRKLTGEETA